MASESSLVFSPTESYTRYLDALLAGDRQRCRSEFQAWLAAEVDVRTLYQDLIQQSLYEIGVLWERGRVSVATEHLATAITESLLTLVYPRLFNQTHLDRSAVVSCVANEYHQIGSRMVADLFEINGWHGYFLGANTPTLDLLGFIQEKRPDAVALSLSVASGLETLAKAALEIRIRHSTLPILVGGQAFRHGGHEHVAQISDVHYLSSLTELETWIKTHFHHAS